MQLSSEHLADPRQQELAESVRACSVSDLLCELREAGVFHAYIIRQNGALIPSHKGILAPLQAFLKLSPDFAEHEGIFIGREEGIETLFFAFVHDTRRGLAQGGLRFSRFATVADVLTDGLRLSQGMTRKNALAGLWWGGGKGIIPLPNEFDKPDHYPQGAGKKPKERTPEEKEKRRKLFEAYGRFVASLGGVYYTAEDIGTKTGEMDAVYSQNRFTTCISKDLGGSGDPSPFTARGVLHGMEAAWQFLKGTKVLKGVRVAVQGVGNVGIQLVDLLDEAGAELWICDKDEQSENLRSIKENRRHIHVVPVVDEIYDLDVEIFAPCGEGGVIDSETIPRLKVDLICGAANNILKEDISDAKQLCECGILFVPDFVCNWMGITNCADEWLGYLDADVDDATGRVFGETLALLEEARDGDCTPTEAANRQADNALHEPHPLPFLRKRGRRIIAHLVKSGWSEWKPPRADELNLPQDGSAAQVA